MIRLSRNIFLRFCLRELACVIPYSFCALIAVLSLFYHKLLADVYPVVS